MVANSRGSPCMLSLALFAHCNCITTSNNSRRPSSPLTVWPPICHHRTLRLRRVRVLEEGILIRNPNYFVSNLCVDDFEPSTRWVVSPCPNLSVTQLDKSCGRFVVSEDSEEGTQRGAIGLAFALHYLVELVILRDFLE